ncbi:PucR family transcriptional regulator, partial [Actinophytocola sediminis]
GVDGLPVALRQAVTAARFASSRGGALVRFESLAGQVLAATPQAHAALAELAEIRLRPLADADRETGSDLVATLRAFLEHHGHVEAAAAALGVHRHTLRARMDRIRHLLDVDLDSAHVRAELLLALVAWGQEHSAATAARSTASPSVSRAADMDSGGSSRSTLP